MRNCFCVILAASVISFAAAHAATPPTGHYAGASVNFFDGPDFEFATPVGGLDVDLNPGAGGSLYYGFQSFNMRFDGSIGYSTFEVDGVSLGTLDSETADGDVDIYDLFVNAYYDVDIGSQISPYMGAGIGAAAVSFDIFDAGGEILEDDTVAFAYQIMAGATAIVGQNVSLFAEAKYRGTGEIEIETTSFVGDQEDDTFSLDSFGVSIGARLSF